MAIEPEDGSTMRGAYIEEFCAVGGLPQAIKLGRVPTPRAPVKNEVLIAVKAASVSGDDVAACQDTAGGGWFMHVRKPTQAQPHVGGTDYAGVVLACGPDCKRLSVGDRVCGVQDIWMKRRPGTWAEQTLCGEDETCLIGDDISFVDAAAVAMGSFVIGDGYKKVSKKLRGGERCLVVGASGALGTVMVQRLKKHEGSAPLHVTGVCSEANAEKVRAMGADEVVDYTSSPFGQQLAGKDKFDFVFDFVGGGDVQRAAEGLIAPGGTFVTAVGPTQYMGVDGVMSFGQWCGALCTILKYVLPSCSRKYKYIMIGSEPPLKQETFDLVAGVGARTTIALETPFALEPFREALRRASSHHAGGRIVLNMERDVEDGASLPPTTTEASEKED